MNLKRYWLIGGCLGVVIYVIYFINHIDPAQKFVGVDYFYIWLPASFIVGSILGTIYKKYKK